MDPFQLQSLRQEGFTSWIMAMLARYLRSMSCIRVLCRVIFNQRWIGVLWLRHRLYVLFYMSNVFSWEVCFSADHPHVNTAGSHVKLSSTWHVGVKGSGPQAVIGTMEENTCIIFFSISRNETMCRYLSWHIPWCPATWRTGNLVYTRQMPWRKVCQKHP